MVSGFLVRIRSRDPKSPERPFRGVLGKVAFVPAYQKRLLQALHNVETVSAVLRQLSQVFQPAVMLALGLVSFGPVSRDFHLAPERSLGF